MTAWLLRTSSGAPSPIALWRRLIADHPDDPAAWTLLGRVGRRLASILRGETDVKQVWAATVET